MPNYKGSEVVIRDAQGVFLAEVVEVDNRQPAGVRQRCRFATSRQSQCHPAPRSGAS